MLFPVILANVEMQFFSLRHCIRKETCSKLPRYNVLPAGKQKVQFLATF